MQTKKPIFNRDRPPDFVCEHGVVYFINPEDRPAATRNFVKTALQMFINGELGNREAKKQMEEGA